MKNKDQILLEQIYSRILKENDHEDELMDNENSSGQAVSDMEGEQSLADKLKEALKTGASFASFMYKAKGTGDTSLFNVNLNVDYQRVKSEDMEKLKNYEPINEQEQEAKESILNPKQRNVIKGDPYESLGKGIKLNKSTNAIHVIGWVQNKEVIVRGDSGSKAPKNSRPLTVAKEDLMRKLELKSMGPTRKIRNFILDSDNISGLRVKGNVIEFQS